MILTLQIIAMVSTIYCVYLIGKQNILGWPTTIVSALSLIGVYILTHLYSQIILQGLYLIQAVYGWYYWNKNNTLMVTKIGLLKTSLGLSIIFGSAAMFILIYPIKFDNMVKIDAISTIIGICATWLLTNKVLETWLLYMLYNFMLIILTVASGLYILVLLNVILFLISLNGYRLWEKRFKHGLVLGKFLVPTLGHYFLIDSAIEQCENVYVMVCSTDKDAVTGLLRTLWLTSKYASENVRVINYANDNPQYPNEAESLEEFYTKYWVPAVYDRIEKLDVIFTSEDYGEEYAYYLGIKHVLVDKCRITYPVSGSGVLKNPDAYWDYIPEVVKSFFKRKIVIIGPESTGKSTLVDKLNRFYTNSITVSEFGREYTEEFPTNELIIDDFEEIASNHKSLIEDAVNKDKRLIFVDTEAIITKTFGEMYLGDDFESPFIDDIIAEQSFDLWLLLDIDVPWVDDGTRDFPHLRKKHMNKIKAELEQHNISYVLINGDYDERFLKAVDEIDKL